MRMRVNMRAKFPAGIAAVVAALTLACLASALGGGRVAAKPTLPPPERNCFFQLLKSKSATIDCEHPAWLTDEERSDLKRLTRELLQNAECNVKIHIERRVVDNALTASDLTFEAPPQPVTCEITTKNGVVPITATFSPRVVFKGGVAVEATPGLANVAGVNSYLAWPVVHYVNNAARIKGAMLLMINAYRARAKELADTAP